MSKHMQIGNEGNVCLGRTKGQYFDTEELQ